MTFQQDSITDSTSLPPMHKTPKLKFRNIRKTQVPNRKRSQISLMTKLLRRRAKFKAKDLISTLEGTNSIKLNL